MTARRLHAPGTHHNRHSRQRWQAHHAPQPAQSSALAAHNAPQPALSSVLAAHDEKRNVFYGPEPCSGESTTTECGVNYKLLAVILLKQPNGGLLVAVDHNQLRTMASDTVDPIDWSHPPPSWAVPLIASCMV